MTKCSAMSICNSEQRIVHMSPSQYNSTQPHLRS